MIPRILIIAMLAAPQAPKSRPILPPQPAVLLPSIEGMGSIFLLGGS